MRRLQLFELEDLPWVPRAIRDGGTDVLDHAFGRFGFYDGVMPPVLAFLRNVAPARIVDLCSGGGGGALQLRQRLRAEGWAGEMVLTDLYPNEAGRARVRALGDARTRYLDRPVDAVEGGAALERQPGGEALDGRDALDGVRTMSGALHHFPPEAVHHLLSGIVARRLPLAFLDVSASAALRRLPTVLLPVAMVVNALVLGVATWLLVPLVRPWRLSRFALTYVLPAIPALFAWDGTVSALRAYAPEELLAMARAVPGGEGYEWDAGTSGSALYLIGRPKPAA